MFNRYPLVCVCVCTVIACILHCFLSFEIRLILVSYTTISTVIRCEWMACSEGR